jgi:glycosyltransferase involved in cell wall biosynthesis
MSLNSIIILHNFINLSKLNIAMTSKKNKLKVVHVVSSLKVGGAERFVIDLCKIQKRQGQNAMIVSLGQPSEPLESECDVENIAFFSSKRLLIIKLIQIYFVLVKADVIHIHSQHALKFLQLLFPFLNKIIIYTRHGADFLMDEHWRKLHTKTQPYIKAATFVSQEGMDNFQSVNKWQNTHCSVIDNGVLINPIKSKMKVLEKLRIGSVGRMIPLKNQMGLLKAIALLSEDVRNNVSVDFFGDGDCLEQLEAFDREYLSSTEVNFHGMVNDRELIYSSFDLLVVTSETEGLSMVIIEAMANQISVIATDVGGNPKLVIPNKTGWLFAYDDDNKLAEIIASIATDKTVLKALGQEAFNYISANFSIESSANKYAELYES